MTPDNHALLLAQITAQEERVWDALKTGDKAADDALLCDHFLGVYPDGFAGKSDHAGQLDEGPTIADYTMLENRLIVLGPDHALLSYLAVFRRSGKTHTERMYVSSVWQRRGTGWINLFSQDTPAAA